MKSMMGAVAGTMIGGFLFKALGMNPGGMGAGGGGGMGFIVILLLIGGGVFLYFRYKKNTAFAGANNQYSQQGFSEQSTRPFERESSHYEEENDLDIPCSGPTTCFSPPEWQVREGIKKKSTFFRK